MKKQTFMQKYRAWVRSGKKGPLRLDRDLIERHGRAVLEGLSRLACLRLPSLTLRSTLGSRTA